MSNLTTTSQTNITQADNIDKHTWSALKDSIYPGAKDKSIMMALDYCKATGLDPLQKPVHLVPMSIKNAATGRYEWRDVVMPGIALYRTQASRSGAYAGVTEPEYGEDVTEIIDKVKITYPKWCKVTVKKIVQGMIVEFSSKEYWLENYATAGKETTAPNSMWKKRPYGQLAKCAEAQALRKAFPETVTALPTAEEMEGKPFMEDVTDYFSRQPKSITKSHNNQSDALADLLGAPEPETITPTPEEEISGNKYTNALIEMILSYNVPEEVVQKWLDKAGVEIIKQLDEEKTIACINLVEQKYGLKQES